MRTISKYMLSVCLASLTVITACTGGSKDSTEQTADIDSVVQASEPINVNGDRLYLGTIVDGSRSNVNLKFYDDTLDFEIPSDLDFTYEVGDSVSILVKTASDSSDSIARIQNLSVE